MTEMSEFTRGITHSSTGGEVKNLRKDLKQKHQVLSKSKRVSGLKKQRRITK